MIYIIAIILSIIGLIINKRIKPFDRKVFLLIIWIYIVLILGFRYHVGIDSLNYEHAYYKFGLTFKELLQTDFLDNKFEPGYLIICAICKSFSKEFWPVQMIVAAVTNGCVFIFLYKYCKNPFWGLIFYFFLNWLYFSTEILREGMAVGVFLLNYKNLQDKKWMKYYLLTLVSILFHYSAFVLLLFPFIRYLNLKITALIFIIFTIFLLPYIEYINNFIGLMTFKLRLSSYIENAEIVNLNWRIMNLIIKCTPALAILVAAYFYKIKTEMSRMVLLQILFCIGAFSIPLIFSRLTNYTSMFVVVMLANFMVTTSIKRYIRNIVFSIVLVSQLSYYYSMLPAWIPYESIFDKKENSERWELWHKHFGN